MKLDEARAHRIRNDAQRIALAVCSLPATSEDAARAYAREIRDVFMAALSELGAQAAVAAIRPALAPFRQDVREKGFDVSTELSHVTFAYDLLERVGVDELEAQSRDLIALCLEGLPTATAEG